MVSLRCHAVRVRVPRLAPGAQKSTYEVISMPLVGPVRTGPGGLGHWGQRQGRVDDVAQQAMSSLAGQVEEAVTTALGRVRPELAGADPLVRRSDRADFQSNVALASAKRVKARPAELAGELAEALHGSRRADRGRRGLRARLPQHHHHGRRRVAPARAAPGRRAARRRPPRAGQPRRHRLLGAQHRQGDARRAPAHDDHRRLARAGARPPRRHRRSGRTTWATGARSSGC